jgi:hypothetical protein
MHARPNKRRDRSRHRVSPGVVRAASSAIFALDAALRGWYGVRPYSYADGVLLRIADGKSDTRVSLEDGTHILPDDPVLELHIWNERVAVLGLPGRNLGWACRVKTRVRNSLHELACRLECDARFGRYVAVRAEAVVLSESAARRFSQIAARFGLEATKPERSASWGHGMLALLLAWACNPAKTFRGHYRPIRREYWISAMELRSRYYRITLNTPTCTLAPAVSATWQVPEKSTGGTIRDTVSERVGTKHVRSIKPVVHSIRLQRNQASTRINEQWPVAPGDRSA